MAKTIQSYVKLHTNEQGINYLSRLQELDEPEKFSEETMAAGYSIVAVLGTIAVIAPTSDIPDTQLTL